MVMCGILYSSNPIIGNLSNLTKRGPDDEKLVQNDLGFFYQSQLSTQVNNIQQPAQSNQGILLYNGTQFELPSNDVSYILNNLTQSTNQCVEFIKTLLGDFAIIWVTEKNIVLARDFGGNKPLFYGISENQFCAASTEQQVKQQGLLPHIVPANTILIFNRYGLITQDTSRDFNLTQHVDNFDCVIEHFERSVLERYQESTALTLSSGIDSGMIAACLNRKKKIYLAATRVGQEDHNILEKRFLLHTGPKLVFNDIELDTFRSISQLQFSMIAQNDQICQVAWYIAEKISKQGYRYILSGTGADEIYSDYGWNGNRYSSYSQFGGIFPNNLVDIWPWMLNNQLPLYDCVLIEDFVYGLHGMDSRNPFLDVRLIQSWLNLVPKLKNDQYKYWQQHYLQSMKFPYTIDKKPLLIPSNVRANTFLNNQQSKIQEKLNH